MKAMILAAGLGTRMGDLTAETPKVLLPVAGKALIDYHLENLAASGVDTVVINLHYLPEKIQQHVGDGAAYGIKVLYSPEAELLGAGGGVHHALRLLGDEPFIVVGGDMWTDYHYANLVGKLQGEAHVVLVDNPPFHPEGDYSLEQGRLVPPAETTYNYAGFGIYTADFYRHAGAGSYGIDGLFSAAMAAEAVTAEYYQGGWANLNTPDQLQRLDEELSLASVSNF